MKEKMETGTDLFRTEKIPKILLKIAPPVMLAQLIQAVYNIVDSFFVGQYSANSLTALSVIYPLQLIIIALAVGTGVGVNTYMARQYAQKCAGAEFQLRDEELWEMPGDHEGQLSVFLWVYADRGGVSCSFRWNCSGSFRTAVRSLQSEKRRFRSLDRVLFRRYFH